MCEGEQGTVWTFEDCYAKKQVEGLVTNGGNNLIGTSACDCCNIPFNINWDRLCDACCYDIEFALDPEFTQIVYPYDIQDAEEGYVPDFDCYCPADEVGAAAGTHPIAYLECYFQPETTYYWRVTATQAATGQAIRSWPSEYQTFTVAPQAEAAAIELVAPAPGALNQPIKNVGFSWNILATADAFDWVLSANPDLSSPLDSKTGLPDTATTYTGTLTHGMTYYWQVTAYNEGTVISKSPIGTFTTGALGPYCDPTTGLCFDTEQALKDYQKTLPTPGTPFWVWVVIGIGAVLVIVVIVLIFRTRRV
jgi:hypothetical protein